MLLIGETYNQRKDFLWSFIDTCRELVITIQRSNLSNTPLAKEVIAENRAIIRDNYAELKELAKWFKQSGLEPDEPYQRKRVKNSEQNK